MSIFLMKLKFSKDNTYLSQLKLEYLNHHLLYSKFWYKSMVPNKLLMTCSVAQKRCYKCHKVNSGNNATNPPIPNSS